jgi:hypothetical protein
MASLFTRLEGPAATFKFRAVEWATVGLVLLGCLVGELLMWNESWATVPWILAICAAPFAVLQAPLIAIGTYRSPPSRWRIWYDELGASLIWVFPSCALPRVLDLPGFMFAATALALLPFSFSLRRQFIRAMPWNRNRAA